MKNKIIEEARNKVKAWERKYNNHIGCDDVFRKLAKWEHRYKELLMELKIASGEEINGE